MTAKEKARANGPIPNAAVFQDITESKASPQFAQASMRSVFGKSYVVVHEPITTLFRRRAPSRIRAWRASA